jgi:flagellar hook-basal body complex protein FliE
MIPAIQAAVSLFGASLNALPVNTPGPEAGGAVATGLAAPAGFGLIPNAAPGTTTAPFADLLTEAVGEVEHLEQKAQVAIEGLISGKGVDVHEAMIAAQKAGMGFELVLSVRNKALAAYQQVMGMQF